MVHAPPFFSGEVANAKESPSTDPKTDSAKVSERLRRSAQGGGDIWLGPPCGGPGAVPRPDEASPSPEAPKSLAVGSSPLPFFR